MNLLNSPISFIKKDKIGILLLFLVVFQYSNFYRVAMRCIYEGSEFQWMQTWGVSILGQEKAMRIMGNGLEGHFLIILLLAVLFVAVVYALIRGSNDSLGKFLVLSFTGVMAVKEIMLSLTYGDQYTVVGETFRLNLEYSILGPVLSLLILGLAVWWAFRNEKPGIELCLSSKANWIAGALCLPCFLLLRVGDQHDWTDILGISLIYIQMIAFLLNWMGAFGNAEKKHLGHEIPDTDS